MAQIEVNEHYREENVLPLLEYFIEHWYDDKAFELWERRYDT